MRFWLPCKWIGVFFFFFLLAFGVNGCVRIGLIWFVFHYFIFLVRSWCQMWVFSCPALNPHRLGNPMKKLVRVFLWWRLLSNHAPIAVPWFENSSSHDHHMGSWNLYHGSGLNNCLQGRRTHLRYQEIKRCLQRILLMPMVHVYLHRIELVGIHCKMGYNRALLKRRGEKNVRWRGTFRSLIWFDLLNIHFSSLFNLFSFKDEIIYCFLHFSHFKNKFLRIQNPTVGMNNQAIAIQI